jgi:hypothetical protein
VSGQPGRVPPEQIESSLVGAALFLTAYHLLRNAIVDNVRNAFLQRGWNYAEYDEQVLSRHRSRFDASLLWLVDVGVLDETQVEEIHEIRRYRNKLAFDLPKLLRTPRADLEPGVLERIGFFVARFDAFFARVMAGDDPKAAARTTAATDPAAPPSDGVTLLHHVRSIVARHQQAAGD